MECLTHLEMGVLACHGLVIRRDIFFFSIKHWLDICRGRTGGWKGTEGTLRRGPRGSERFDWRCIASYYFYLSTKLWEARFCKAAKLIGSNLRCIQHRETRKTGDFLDPFVKSSYAHSVLVRDQREFSFSLKIKLETERKSSRSDTRFRYRNSFSHLESQNRLLVKHWL